MRGRPAAKDMKESRSGSNNFSNKQITPVEIALGGNAGVSPYRGGETW